MEETLVKKEVRTDFLKNETVIVQFIPKPTKEITDPKHIAYGGKLQGTFDYIPPPKLRKDKLKNILTNEEKEGLEYLMKGVDLSIYGDFWKSYKKGGLFPIALGKDDKYLDLSIPEDYIIYKVLINNPLIANSQDQLKNEPRATYKYVMVKENEHNKNEEEAINDRASAFEFFSKIKSSESGLRFVLSALGKHTHKNQDIGFLRKEVGKAIDDYRDIKIILKLAEDKYFDVKVLLEDAFTLGVIEKISGQYFTKENEPIAGTGLEPNIDNASKFLA